MIYHSSVHRLVLQQYYNHDHKSVTKDFVLFFSVAIQLQYIHEVWNNPERKNRNELDEKVINEEIQTSTKTALI